MQMEHDLLVTQGQPCKICGRRVFAWDRAARGSAWTDSISASAAEATTSRQATVTHQACFLAQARANQEPQA